MVWGLGGRRWTGARPVLVDARQREQASVVLAATPARNWGRVRFEVRFGRGLPQRRVTPEPLNLGQGLIDLSGRLWWRWFGRWSRWTKRG
jgi:hypothetical protein